jgi:RND family efflux transporter MFP subunit
MGLAAGLLLGAGAMVLAPRFMPQPVTAPAVTPAVTQGAPASLTVSLLPVVETSLVRPVLGDGSVVAWQELVVGIETGGLRVLEVPVEPGDRVRQGQVLARLDDAVPAAQAAQANAAVTEAEAALTTARADLRRSAELARTDSVARQTLEQRQSAALQAEARLLMAIARRDEAAARLAQTRILAPADGIVSRRGVLPGAVAQPGQEAMRLIRDGRLELDARVPELDLATVVPGQPVRVRHGAQDITGEVRALAPVVGSDTRLGIVHVALPPDSGLRPGMFAQAEILPAPQPALTVPQEAVVVRDGHATAFVLPIGADQVAQRAVITGARRDGMVEITAGLAAGEQVVVTGAGFLSDGDRIRVAAPR